MIDAIDVRDIRAYGRHGANPHERDHAQPFDISIRLGVDLTAARASDDLADTVDYAAVRARIVAIVADRSYRLLERLADEILADVMRDARIAEARVTIAKPALLDGATPVVSIGTRRGD